MTRLIFTPGIFVGSFLLFLIQPMVGKILLPGFGGVPAVWTTCMLFFQAALLAGYLYAERSISLLGFRRQSILHLLLLLGGIFFLPLDIDLSDIQNAVHQPATWLFSRLTISIGYLFFLIAANAPLLQRYYSYSEQNDASDPYFLYSASNAGSLMALLAYPFLFEPFLRVSQQKSLWSALYLLQILLVLFCISRIKKKDAESLTTRTSDTGRLPLQNALLWTFLGFVPCSAMLAVTTHIATDIASGPLLWIFPLSIYLISFILVFAKNPLWREIQWGRRLIHGVVLSIILYYFMISDPVWLVIPLHFLTLFLVCMYFHGRLAGMRPSAGHLNSYFVWMSVGGIAGGVFNGLIAPLAFATQAEYIITMLVSGLAVSLFSRHDPAHVFSRAEKALLITAYLILIIIMHGRFPGIGSHFLPFGTAQLAAFTIVSLMLFFRFRAITLASLAVIYISGQLFGPVGNLNLLTTRSFFGILKVNRVISQDAGKFGRAQAPVDVFYKLSHGTTMHGVERKVDVRPVFPLAYYSRESPIGAIFRAGRINRASQNIGIVGLGCGTLAWYGRPWQHFDLYEIDPEVIKIAENPAYFTYLKNSRASWKNIVGDARINLQAVPDKSYDLLVIDAYSSDAVPTHLLTLEAFRLYRSKLKDNGILALHTSNRYFDLPPVIRRICDEIGMRALVGNDNPKNYSIRYDDYDLTMLSRSQWVAVTGSEQVFRLLQIFWRWESLPEKPGMDLWTDDHASLFQVYKWR